MRLSKKTKEMLEKAKENCLLAVDIYNKPRTAFRSGAYVVLMSIAYTSLFHAIFEKNKIKYYYKIKGSSRYQKIDGDYKAWEISTCIAEYFKNPTQDELPIKKNIEFFIPLRNKIEHRFMPELDSEIFGECQALLHNFEYLLEKEFGPKHKVCEDLLFSLQFAQNYIKDKNAYKRKNKDFDKIKKQIINYRESLADKVYSSQKYSFKIYLLPKLVNNENKADYAIEWINYDEKNPNEMEKYNHLIGFVKEKIQPIANYGLLKAGEVSNKVLLELKKTYGKKVKFNASSHHVICYKHYNIRSKDRKHPENTNKKYCIYDQAHNDYVYTDEWVKFLIEELSNKKTFLKLFPRNKELLEEK